MTAMRIDDETCFRALAARDARFDGLFFVGVTTTRIYCRPICPARMAGRDRCRFFGNAALAEREGFRPCLRCRPELAPGHAPVHSVRRTARAAAARIEGGPERWGQPDEARPRPGPRRAATPPRGPTGVRRIADRAGPDPPAAPGQTTTDRVGSADRPGGVRQRVRQCPTIQRPVPIALPPTPTIMRRSSPKAARTRLSPAHPGVPAAPGLGCPLRSSRAATTGVEQVEAGRTFGRLPSGRIADG